MKVQLLTAILVGIICMAGLKANSRENPTDTTKVKRIGILPVPALGYSPETDFYFGAVALFTFTPDTASHTRTSNAKAEFNYTLKKQVISEIGWNYFFPREQWFSRGNLQYSKYPDLFYGIGAETADSNEVTYSSHRIVAQITLLRKISDKTFFGPCFRYGNYSNFSYDKGNTYIYSGLSPATILGYGLTLLHDSRDNLLNPSKGQYGEVNFTLNNWSATTYRKMVIDLRKYFSFSLSHEAVQPKNRYNSRYPHTLSIRVLAELTSAPAPFFDQVSPGGDSRVRGYLYGRFRDLNMVTFQSEYRSPYAGRFALAVFGGISGLFSNHETMITHPLKPNYGLGVRFLTDRRERINLRLDYAIGQNGQDGFYISFGESF